MEQILVTGGTGFIGTATCMELVRRGYVPTVLDPRVRPDGSPRPYRTMLGDIRDPVAVNQAVAHADGVIHLAGVLGTQETITNPVPAALTNVVGGLNVLQAAAEYGVPTINIGVGNWFENNTYSLTKNTVERFVHMYTKYRKAPIHTVRALNAYGPGQSVAAPYGSSKVRKIGPSFIFRALHGDPVEIYGDGLQVMDMVHVGDVARVLVSALEWVDERPTACPHTPIFEVGTGRKTTVLEIAQCVNRIVKESGAGPGSDIEHLPMRPGETPGVEVFANVDTLKPLEEYGIVPDRFVTLEDGMAETVEWYRRNGAAI